MASAKEVPPFGEEPTIKLEEENLYKTVGSSIGKFPWCLLSISFYNTVLPVLAFSHFSESKCLFFLFERKSFVTTFLHLVLPFFVAIHF